MAKVTNQTAPKSPEVILNQCLHDLSTPVSALYGYLHLLTQKTLPPSEQELLTMAQLTTNQLANIIEQYRSLMSNSVTCNYD